MKHPYCCKACGGDLAHEPGCPEATPPPTRLQRVAWVALALLFVAGMVRLVFR